MSLLTFAVVLNSGAERQDFGERVYTLKHYPVGLFCMWCSNIEVIFAQKTLGFDEPKWNWMPHECIAICLVYCHVLSSVQRMPCSDHILHPWPGNTVAMELLYDGIYGNKNVKNILDMNWNNTGITRQITFVCTLKGASLVWEKFSPRTLIFYRSELSDECNQFASWLTSRNEPISLITDPEFCLIFLVVINFVMFECFQCV